MYNCMFQMQKNKLQNVQKNLFRIGGEKKSIQMISLRSEK